MQSLRGPCFQSGLWTRGEARDFLLSLCIMCPLSSKRELSAHGLFSRRCDPDLASWRTWSIGSMAPLRLLGGLVWVFISIFSWTKALRGFQRAPWIQSCYSYLHAQQPPIEFVTPARFSARRLSQVLSLEAWCVIDRSIHVWGLRYANHQHPEL